MDKLQSLSNAIRLKHSVVINSSPSKIFEYLEHLDKNYLKLSDGHIGCEILNADKLQLGGEVICQEKAGNQQVKHHFIVQEFIPNKRILLFSEKSEGKVEHREFFNSTYVLQELNEVGINKTQITTQVFILLPNFVIKILALLTGTKRIWGTHVKDETETLKKELENDKT